MFRFFPRILRVKSPNRPYFGGPPKTPPNPWRFFRWKKSTWKFFRLRENPFPAYFDHVQVIFGESFWTLKPGFLFTVTPHKKTCMIVVPKLLRILDHTWETFRKKKLGFPRFSCIKFALQTPWKCKLLRFLFSGAAAFLFPFRRFRCAQYIKRLKHAGYTRLIAERTIWIEAFLHFVDWLFQPNTISIKNWMGPNPNGPLSKLQWSY